MANVISNKIWDANPYTTSNSTDVYNTLTGGSITIGNPTTASSHWEELNSNKMTFKVGDEEITFEDNELIYLKEMLTEWIEENRPESLL